MPDDLTVDAVVDDHFSGTLDNLADSLVQVGQVAEAVFPIEASVSGDEQAVTKLTAVAEAAERVDDVDVDIDSQLGNVDDVDDNQIFDAEVALSDEEALGVADLFNPKSAFRQTPGMDAGDAVTPDGGGDEDDAIDIDRLADVLGDAFDSSQLLETGGDVRSPSRLIEGGFEANFDTEGIAEAFVQGTPDDMPDVDEDILDALSPRTATDVDVFDDAIDALDELDLVTGDLAGEQRSLLHQIEQFTPKMGDFFKVFAALIPLIGVFVGALPAAIAGVGALAVAALTAAGALAAVGGLGILGLGLEDGEFSMDALTDHVTELRDAFIEAFGPVAQSFAPLMEDLLDDVRFMFDELAARSHVLRALREDFHALGEFITGTLPGGLAALARLGTATVPIFEKLFGFVGDVDVVRVIADVLSETLPLLAQIGIALVEALPGLFRMSKGFLMMAAAITTVISVLFQVIEALGPLGVGLGAVIGAMLTLASISGLLSLSMGLLTSEFVTMAASALPSVVTAMGAYTESMLLGAGATATMASAASLLIEILTVGLATAAIGYALVRLNELRQSISETTQELDALAGTNASVGVSGVRSAGSGGRGTANPYVDIDNNYEVNASDREEANRQTESLNYNDNYTSGSQDDATFGTSGGVM
jgi:hypothetical protein